MNTDKQQSNPLTDFSGCHVYIIRNLLKLEELAELIQQPDKSELASKQAAEIRQFYYDVILKHHIDEENELFAIIKSVLDKHSEQALLLRGHIGRLTEEHRYLEKLWADIEPDLKLMEKGKPVQPNIQSIHQLSADYLAHATFEEQEFLPLVEKILNTNELSALALSVHMRHTKPASYPYI